MMLFNQKKKLQYVVLAIVAIAISIQSVCNNFLFRWDDQWVVINAFTEQGFNVTNLWHVLTQFYHGQYAPMNELYYICIYSIFGYNSYVFHAGGVLLHTANVLLAYSFVGCLQVRMHVEKDIAARTAFITALIFAVHPVCVESVAWLSASKILVYSFFYLIALCIYMRYIAKPSAVSYLLVLFFFILSFAGKEQAVVFVVCCIIIDYAVGRRESYSMLILEKAPLLMLALFFGIVTIMSQGNTSGGDMPQYDLPERCLLACFSLFEYFSKAVVPFNLSYIYPFPFQPSDPIPVHIYVYPFLILAASFVVYSVRKNKIIVFAAAFFVTHLLVALHIVPISRFAVTADRYSYMSLIGTALLLGNLYVKYSSHIKAIKPIFVVYIIYLSVMTVSYNSHWRNSEILKHNMREILKSRQGNDDSISVTDTIKQSVVTIDLIHTNKKRNA